MVNVETGENDNKRKKCAEDDLLSNKRVCLSPSITELPSVIHDSPAMPVPSSSHDLSVISPQSSSGDLPVKLLHPEHPTTTSLHSSSKDLISSPSSHDLPATPPGSHPDVSNIPLHSDPVDSVASHLTSHDSAAILPHLHGASVNPHSSSCDAVPSSLDRCDASLQHNSPTGLLSTSPSPTTEQQDQLEFSDPVNDIINTQLNHQITEVQHFLKTDRLKRTKLPDTNTIQ